MAEVVRLAQAGFTVSAADPAQMAAAILQMAGSETARAEFSANAKAAFQSRFTLQTMVDAYMDLYRNTPRTRYANWLKGVSRKIAMVVKKL